MLDKLYHPISKINNKQQLIHELTSALSEKIITCFISEKDNLIGFDYTEKCQYDKLFDKFPITKICRGIVFDTNYNLVALPYPKFFNFSESECDVKLSEVITLPYITTTTKIDGSCGIIYFHKNKWKCNTRGSFISDQAVMAQSWLDQMNLSQLNINYTYICEIIYPKNRVVVDYKEFQGLVLLGAYDKITFEDKSFEVLNSCNTFHDKTKISLYTWNELSDLMKTLSYNEEGFVIIMPDGKRFKMKGEEYCRIHKIKSNLNPKFLWEVILNRREKITNIFETIQIPQEIAVHIPEEFINEMEIIWNDLVSKFNNEAKFIQSKLDLFKANDNFTSQKDKALFIMANAELKDWSSFIFDAIKRNNFSINELALSNQKVFEAIVKKFKPVGE